MPYSRLIFKAVFVEHVSFATHGHESFTVWRDNVLWPKVSRTD